MLKNVKKSFWGCLKEFRAIFVKKKSLSFRGTSVQPFFKLSTTPILLLVGAILIAQDVAFRDAKGNMALENMTSWTTIKKSENVIEFRGAGKPLLGSWRDQNLKLRGNQINGVARRKGDGTFWLSEAKVSGEVRLDLQKKNPKTSEQQSVTAVCQNLEIEADQDKTLAHIKGGVTITARSSDGPKILVIQGASANLTLVALDQKSDYPLQKAVVNGPVTLKLETHRPREQKERMPSKNVVTAKGARLVYDDAARTIVLDGGVRVESEDELLGGEVQAKRAIIRLNDKREVISAEFEGEPGTATLREKPARSSGG